MNIIPNLALQSNNLLINTNMELPQRVGSGNGLLDANGYALDRWLQAYYENDTLTPDFNGFVRHQTAPLPGSGTLGVLLIGGGGALTADTIRIVQRVESLTTRYIQASKMVLQMKLQRPASLAAPMFDTEVRFSIFSAPTLDTYGSLFADRDVRTQIEEPIKVGGVSSGSLTLGDISNSEFETFFVGFDTPTDVTNGFEVDIQLVRPNGDPLVNDDFLYVTDAMLSVGGTIQSYIPMGMGIAGIELSLAQRYFWKNSESIQIEHFMFTNNLSRFRLPVLFPVPMRVPPSMAVAVTNASNVRLNVVDNAKVIEITKDGFSYLMEADSTGAPVIVSAEFLAEAAAEL